MDQEPNFADVLRASIERHYDGNQGAFARAAGVAPASVSRWLGGLIPSQENVEQIAPYVLDAKGHPIPASRLNHIARPGLAPARGERVVYLDRPQRALHQFALEADGLLADDGPLTPQERKDLSVLLDSLLRPYRRRLGKRKAG